MRVDPSYDPAIGYLVDGLNSVNGQDNNLPPEIQLQENTVPLTFSSTFLHHHALKDVQIVSVSSLLQREVQVIDLPILKSALLTVLCADNHYLGHTIGYFRHYHPKRGLDLQDTD